MSYYCCSTVSCSHKWYSCTYNPTCARGKYIDLDFIVSNIFGELDDSIVMKGDREKECGEEKSSRVGETRENFEGENYEWGKKNSKDIKEIKR